MSSLGARVAAWAEDVGELGGGEGHVHGPEMDVEPTEERLPVTADDIPGSPSVFACPECGGSLWEIRDGELARFRCRVGHAYAPQALFEQQNISKEAALWTAVRSLEENGDLAERIAKRFNDRGMHRSAVRFEARASEVRHRAAVLRGLLVGLPGPEPPGAATEAAEFRKAR